MYEEKIFDNMYGVDIRCHSVDKISELKDNAIIHMIVHHITDKKIIKDIVDLLLKKGCKIFHLFGEYHYLWEDELKRRDDSLLVVVDYRFELDEFEMDLATHLIEQQELRNGISVDFKSRIDYILYDDMMFFWWLSDDMKEYRCSENVR